MTANLLIFHVLGSFGFLVLTSCSL